MRILTSYYSRLKINRAAFPEMRHISISRSTPKWAIVDGECKVLAPSWKVIKLNEVDYVPAYNEILASLDPADIAAQLDGSIIYCYERPEQFCHRHLVANWLRKNIDNIEICEISPESAV